jgi:hypothetical protein
VALTPLIFTTLSVVVVLKLVPVTVTEVHAGPICGVIDVIVTGGITVKDGPFAIIPFVSTVTTPEVAEAGTTTTSSVAPAVETVAVMPLNLTVFEEAVVLKFVPVIVTFEPGKPSVGLIFVIVGGGITVNAGPSVVLLWLNTLTVPEVAFAGTETTIWLAITEDTVACVPLKNTLASVAKLLPEIVTDVPAGPWSGVTFVMIGAGSSSSFLQESKTKIAVRTQHIVNK